MGPGPANHFWRRGRIFAFLMVNFCFRGRILGAISGEGVRFPARSSEPPTKHRWITIDGGVKSGAALTDQKPSPQMRSKMQPLRQKMQPCNPQMRLGLASRTEANASLSSEGVAGFRAYQDVMIHPPTLVFQQVQGLTEVCVSGGITYYSQRSIGYDAA